MSILDAPLAALSLVFGGISAYALARKRNRHDSAEHLSQLNQAKAEAARLLENARKDVDAALERARRDADELKKQAEETKSQAEELRRQAEETKWKAEGIKKEAEIDAKAQELRALQVAKEEGLKFIAELERKLQERDERVSKREKIAVEMEALLAEKDLSLTKRESAARAKESQLDQLTHSATTLVNEQKATLEAIAGMSGDEARSKLMSQFYDAARHAAAREAKTIEDTAREEAEKRAKRIIGVAIQRYAGDHVQERSVTSVHLPNDDLKGRIIGREGRNIRSLQEACGVDFIVDDTPETIVISGFDPIRREVARLALEKLIQDGRIHPTRIEELVFKAQEEVERSVTDAAEHALMELGVTRVHPEVQRLLGKLKYRYSYAQNVLKHSIECGFLCGLMAAELGLNEKQAKRAALLHDIGKAVSHEQEGGHAMIGGQYARKYGEDPIVANAIACHHDDEPAISVYGHLVTASDALSGARPGARREMFESYIKRLQDLEAISYRFTGVERAYAIQAGREVRVMVEPSEVSDAEAALLAREISKRIEEELSYPGQIRVTVVRETRAVDYAK